MFSGLLADILHAQAGDAITVIPVKGERRPIEVLIDEQLPLEQPREPAERAAAEA